MSLAAGELTACIAIEKREGKDALNQPLNVWVPHIAKLWAKPIGTTGYASMKAGAEGGISRALDTYTFRVRYREDIADTGYRVVYRGRHFNIKLIRQDLARQEWTDIVCEAGENNG